MPQRILALDIEDAEVKAAVLETSFRDYHIAGLYHDLLSPEGGSVPDQLRRFLERHQLAGDTVVSTLPGRLVSHRVFFLPFRDRKRLNQTIPFELETHVPFGLDEVIVDYQVLHRDSSGTTVLAAMVQKPDLEAHLAMLQAVGIDPKVVDFAPLSALNVLRVLGDHLPSTFAFVDFSTATANVSLYRNGQLAGLRTLSVASGGAATNGASRNGRLDAELPPSAAGEQSDDAVRAAAVDLRWSLLVINGAPLDERLPCYLAGPPAWLERVGPVLQRELSLDVRRLDRTPLRALPAEVRGALPECAIPLGLALREVAPANTLGLNFRRAEFSYHRGQEEVRRALGRVAALAAILIVLAVVNVFFSYPLQVSRLAAIDSQIRYVFQKTLPDERPVEPRAQLQGEVDRLEQKVKLLGGIVSLSGAAAIDVMRSISTALPANLKLDIDEYNFDPDGVRIRGKTDEFETVDKIKQNLISVPYFKDVQVKDVKAAPDGKGVSFRLILVMGNEARTAVGGE
jgi:general secretion pathway protein L